MLNNIIDFNHYYLLTATKTGEDGQYSTKRKGKEKEEEAQDMS